MTHAVRVTSGEELLATLRVRLIDNKRHTISPSTPSLLSPYQFRQEFGPNAGYQEPLRLSVSKVE